ncbi:ABC transporter permease [Fundidesulfovibrio terrae]|uniref:ABC transporter permease n=1 Tax=Fundidesulfovibrio terrae TaxID=2922866 RepID=UPI001FAED43B|nr:ABC transporter permease [Fundidesulfovibrio terrae]
MRKTILAQPHAGLTTTLRQSLALASPLGVFVHFLRCRELLREFTRLEFSGRYQGTMLGPLWSLITPLVTLGVYTFVFSAVFKTSWSGAGQGGVMEFALSLLTGLACFEVVSGAASRGALVMSENVNFVKKVVFPLEVLPVSVALALTVQSLLSLGLVCAARLATGAGLPETALLAPLGYVPLALLAAGLGLWLAPVGVAAKDVGHMITAFMQLYFFLTPIVYPLSAVPDRYRPLLALNPLHVVIEHFRRTLLWGLEPDWTALGLTTAFSAVFLLAGFAWFMQLKKVFADVL